MTDTSADATEGHTDGLAGEAAAEEFDPAAAFALLGDQTRLGVLRALWEAGRETPGEPVPFERLRERVGVDDSGRFNYHLGKLVGRFVARDEDGYRLRFAGARVVGALLEGTYAPGEEFSVAVEGPCDDCGGERHLRYADERVSVACRDCGDRVTDFGCPPGVVTDRPREAVAGAVDTHLRSSLARADGGVCPGCSGPMHAELVREPPADLAEPDEDDDAERQEATAEEGPLVVAVCERCGERVVADLLAFLIGRSAVVSFLHERGVDPAAVPVWALRGAVAAESRLLTDEPEPPRAESVVRAREDALVLVVDADCAVTETRIEAAG